MTPHLMYTPVSPAIDLAVTARQGLYDAPTLLFVHGLGDSALAWRSFFDDERLASFTLLAPDLPGYGDTQLRGIPGGGFDNHLAALRHVMRDLIGGECVVIAHSMGGLLATLLLREIERGEHGENGHEPLHSPVTLKGFINVEGNLTADDAFISGRAVAASKGRRPFADWYDAYRTTTHVGPWAKAHPHLSHYADSLAKCDPETFLRDSRELVEWREREDERTGEPAAGAEYLRLRLPKCYVCGSESLPRATADFLVQNKTHYHEVEGGTHWTMLDDPDLIIDLIHKRLGKAQF